MYGNTRFALLSPEGDEAGGGAPAGGSPEGDLDKTPKGDDVVPKSQFIAAINSAEQKREREIAALRAEFEAKLEAATKPKAEPQKEYTRVELNAMVEAGSISQAQADQQLDLQARETAKAIATQVATSIVADGQRKGYVESEIARYTELIPEIRQAGTTERDKVEKEFRFLRSLGDPANEATELKALRAVYGPVETLQQARKGKPSHESHQEHGAGGGAGPRGGEGNLKLSEKERAHYQKGIEAGRYKDWKAVETELKFANASTRRKHGAPA